MNAAKSRSVGRRVLSWPLFFPLLLLPVVILFATLLSAELAFAGLSGGNPSGPAARGNGPAQGTPTATPTCSPWRVWSIVSSPNQGSSSLYGVSAVSSNDVWAVGYYSNGSSLLPLTEHWNGSSWSIVPSPAINGGLLHGVAAVSSNDVWAVGEYYNSGGSLTLHWGGSSWSVVPRANQEADSTM